MTRRKPARLASPRNFRDREIHVDDIENGPPRLKPKLPEAQISFGTFESRRTVYIKDGCVQDSSGQHIDIETLPTDVLARVTEILEQ